LPESMLLNMTWPSQLLQRRDEAPCIWTFPVPTDSPCP
jgi:hypothetical protein